MFDTCAPCSEQVPLDGVRAARQLHLRRHAGGLQVRGHGRPLPLLRPGGHPAHGNVRRAGYLTQHVSTVVSGASNKSLQCLKCV